jgi:hypothetical protein
MRLADAMRNASFVQVNGVVFEADYLREPDEDTYAEDVLIEVHRGDTLLAFTREDLEGAQYLGEGAYQLRSGARIQFLLPAVIH